MKPRAMFRKPEEIIKNRGLSSKLAEQALINAKTNTALAQSKLLESRHAGHNRKDVQKCLLEWKQSLNIWEKRLDELSSILQSWEIELSSKLAKLEEKSMSSFWQSLHLPKYASEKGFHRRFQNILDQLKNEWRQSGEVLKLEELNEKKASFSLSSLCHSFSLFGKTKTPVYSQYHKPTQPFSSSMRRL